MEEGFENGHRTSISGAGVRDVAAVTAAGPTDTADDGRFEPLLTRNGVVVCGRFERFEDRDDGFECTDELYELEAIGLEP